MSCAVTQALVVEVSDAGAVGVITVPLGPSLARPVNVLADQVVGVAERLADRGCGRTHDEADGEPCVPILREGAKTR